MWTRLIRARRPRFSKTARSGPRLGEAGRDRSEVRRAPAIRGRRLADDLGERAAEGAQAGEADVEADLSDAAVALPEQEHRALDPAPLQVAVRRLSEGGAEDPYEMRLRDVGDLRQRRDVERPRIVAVHRVARPQHAAVRLLDRAAHRGQAPAC